MSVPDKKKGTKPTFEPLVPLGIFLIMFGVIIVYATIIPKDFVDKMVNLVSGLAFLIWGGVWFYVGFMRMRKMRERQKDEKL